MLIAFCMFGWPKTAESHPRTNPVTWGGGVGAGAVSPDVQAASITAHVRIIVFTTIRTPSLR
jgi:hypothetical protein